MVAFALSGRPTGGGPMVWMRVVFVMGRVNFSTSTNVPCTFSSKRPLMFSCFVVDLLGSFSLRPIVDLQYGFLATLVLSTAALVHGLYIEDEPVNTRRWTNCTTNKTLPVGCANLTVPLDYSDASSKQTLTMALVRYGAARKVSQGSVLFNPGGPGQSGRTIVSRGGRSLSVSVSSIGMRRLTKSSRTVGGHYDLIGFDPRCGSRSQILHASCNPQATFAAMFPDKVDRMVLDGVPDMRDDYAGQQPQCCTPLVSYIILVSLSGFRL